MEEGADITTSQPSPGEVTDFWDKLLKEYDEILYIPMSSGLSGSCQTAIMLADDYDGKVQVVKQPAYFCYPGAVSTGCKGFSCKGI